MTDNDTLVQTSEPSGVQRYIVVGIDGSEESTAALAFAYEEAELRGIELQAIYACDVPARWAEAYNPAWPVDEKRFRDSAEKDAAGFVEQYLAGKPQPAWLKISAVDDYPSTALMARAEHAHMLVVGSRGRGGFKRMLLGSVSSACVNHARCPVVVVRPPVAA